MESTRAALLPNAPVSRAATGWLLFAVLLSLSAQAWIDYGDKVVRTEPEFGKEFQGFSLKLSTANIEFEQDMPEKITIVIKNTTKRTSLFPKKTAGEGRNYALYVVVADKEGQSSLFSRNVFRDRPNRVAKGNIPAGTETMLLTVPFNALEVAKVDEYENGMPYFDEKKRMTSAGQLPPQIYTIKAVLLAGLPDSRPDFVIASPVWRILLLPKSVKRMGTTEKQTKMKAYLAKMAEGAYGGVGVSSQLAAFGDEAVDPLIKMAEKTGDETVMQSRIWAIVTLCGTRAPRAEEYIIQKLHDPVGFGDLSFLAWHSQAFHSQRITEALDGLAVKIASDSELPWEKKHGPESRRHGAACLKFILKHFVSRGLSVGDDVVVNAVKKLEAPEMLCLSIQVWKPSSPRAAAEALKTLFTTPYTHPNLKRVATQRLGKAWSDQGFPPFDRKANVDLTWQDAGMWLAEKGLLSKDETTAFLRAQVMAVRDPAAQTRIIADLRNHLGDASPVKAASPVLPDAWIQSWQWMLKTAKLPKEEAVRFLCNQMRTREELDDSVKRALLVALKGQLGEAFPLKATSKVDLDEDWPTCGNWLIEKGHFKPPRKRR